MARLEVGDRAPAFTLVDQHGEKVKLSDFKGRKVIVYFYPKADTPGCTIESCGFKELYPQFQERGIEILGCSFDTVDENAAFAEKFDLPYSLLCDVDREIEARDPRQPDTAAAVSGRGQRRCRGDEGERERRGERRRRGPSAGHPGASLKTGPSSEVA